MEIMRFIIQGKLPSLNDIIKAAKTSPYVYSNMKRKYGDYVMWSIKLCCKNVTMITVPVDVEIKWYEKNNRRDVDNIVGGGCKIILDSLVDYKVLKDDSQKFVRHITNEFLVDSNNPRIEVCIKKEQT